MNRTKFLNLIKQYWNSNPEKSFEEIIEIFLIDADKSNVIDENTAKNKISRLCQENNEIDNFIDLL